MNVETKRVIAKVELIYEEGKGATITSEFEGDNGEWEFLLASMLVEMIAVRQGKTVEEVSENILGSVNESGSSYFNITRDLREKGADEYEAI